MDRIAGVPSPVLVRFLNPTTNKALHIGHIRGAYLGSAAAACFSFLGCQVATHCILEDVGPHMALAIHGLDHMNRKKIIPEVRYPKSDHEAHAYYIHGGRLFTSSARSKRPTRRTVQLWNAKIPDRLMIDWARGSPSIVALAARIRDLAVRGQSKTLEQLGVGISYCDFESAETPYLYKLVEDGIRLGIFKRLRNGGVICEIESGRFPLRCANVHFEESAYLLSFLYRCLKWGRPEWSHVAFAGKEWARVMRHFPGVLERLGVKHAKSGYRLAFYGMVTTKGHKVSSSYGRGLLADELFDVVTSLPQVQRLVQLSNGILSAAEIARAMLRVGLLGASAKRDLEFSLKLFGEPSARHWSIAGAVASVCGAENKHFDKLGSSPGSGPEKDRIRELAHAAVRDCTFEPIVAELAAVCNELRRNSLPGRTRAEYICRMSDCLQLLGAYPVAGLPLLHEAPSFLQQASNPSTAG